MKKIKEKRIGTKVLSRSKDVDLILLPIKIRKKNFQTVAKLLAIFSIY